MDNLTNIEVSTKADARAEATTTNLTIDWEGMSPEDVRALAQQALVVKLQSGWRKNGIPDAVTVKAVEHKVGARQPRKAPDLLALVGSLTPEQKAALLAKLTG